jgi:hypothetical protein
MRKFLMTVLILIILGGAAFFFGWVQLTVPPGAYGVMRSKTHGVDPRLIREGEFRWAWYKLIPTNTEIRVFSTAPAGRSISSRGLLPSGAAYTSLAGLNADFSYEISGNLSFNLKPDSLPALIARYNIGDQAGLDAFTETLAGEIEAYALRRLRFYAEDEQKMEEIFTTGALARLSEDINGAFPDIENLSCIFHGIRFPDFALYRSVRAIYEDYLASQRAYLRDDVNREAETRLSSQFRFDELEKYGELLTKYPVLLRYLALEKGGAGPGDLLKILDGE